jgi:3-methyladenine DNA glycosylase AlkC
MPEPFKNFFNTKIIRGMAKHFLHQWPEFDNKGFTKAASKNLDALELKERSDQIMNAMVAYLPSDFKQAGGIILASLSPALEGDIADVTVDNKGIAGWAILPITHYVGLQGQEHFTLSMTLFKELTKRFTSEFGIRFFLLSSPQKTLSTLKKWTKDKDRHVRRLVSEGTRPRLPWAMQLPLFIKDPAPVIELLETLKDDNEEYVRRSVANSLNDIAKDHPDVVAKISKKWIKDADSNRKKLIRHACRTLIKNGDKKVLKVFGYAPPIIRKTVIKINTPEVVFGTALEFTLSISSDSDQAQPLLIDYIVHHQKANGTTSPKVFKWQNKTLEANKTLTSTKKHPIKKITTRVYYPGVHTVEVMVNGTSVATADFQLLMP